MQEETDCVVCFSRYDGEKHRPRFMPCGHTLCTECLEKNIRENSKMCPTCKKIYQVSNVEELPVNFTVESLLKLLDKFKDTKSDKSNDVAKQPFKGDESSETLKADKLPECPEHQLPVSNRCATHKAWVCQSCVKDDHSPETCQIITISEELDIKKSRQLEKAQPLLDIFEDACKKSNDCKEQYQKLVKEFDEEIIRIEAIVERLQEDIKRKKSAKQEIEEKSANLDKKLNSMKDKSSYEKAVTMLQSSKMIRDVSRCSVEVQTEAEKLRLVSSEIENEVDLMLQQMKDRAETINLTNFGYPKLSIMDEKYHIHALKLDENNVPLTDGIMTFLDIAWPNQDPRRVYIKMLGNTARVRQHLLIVTGHCNASYLDLDFNNIDHKGQPGECIRVSPYDGKRAASVLPDVTINDDVKREEKCGLVAGVYFTGDKGQSMNNALFAVYLRDDPGFKNKSIFAQVVSGLNVLQDIANSEERDKIKIVDCGVVVSTH